MLVTGEGALGRSLRLLAENDTYPAVFHCAAGKDRTGILAALCCRSLGVPDDVIVEDYALSGEGVARMIDVGDREHARGTRADEQSTERR